MWRNFPDLPSLFLPVHTVRMNWRWKWLRNKPCTTMIKTIIYSRSDKPYFCHVRLHCRWVEAQSVCGERPERTLIHQSLWEVDLWVLLLYSLIVSRGGEGLGVRFWVWERGYILHSSNKMKVIMLSPFRQGTVRVCCVNGKSLVFCKPRKSIYNSLVTTTEASGANSCSIATEVCSFPASKMDLHDALPLQARSNSNIAHWSLGP